MSTKSKKTVETLEKTLNKSGKVETAEELELLIERVKKAQKIYSTYTQEQVDKIFKAAATAADKARIPLAKLAYEETGMGVVEDKIIKNHFASEYIYNKHKNAKTCGIIKEDKANGIKTVAEPLGVIAGIVPTTNPSSTAIFKSLICLKTRNAIIFSPHPRAPKSTIAAAKVVLDAAVKAGAPEDIIGWIDTPSIELSSQLMKHPDISCILATGGPGMVKAAYSSGNPALGVGPGNAAAVIDETADIKMAVSSILMSKTFDNGMICASENSVIVVDDVYEKVKKEFVYRGAYLLNASEEKKMLDLPFIDPKRGTAHPKIVGQPATEIAKLAGFEIPETSKILLAERPSVDWSDPFSREKLSPILTMYRAKDYKEAFKMANELVTKGGAGHTADLYTDARSQERIDEYAKLMPACRILINSPSAQGGIGDLYNFKLEPSLSLGCGSWGKNAVSGNIGVENLLNYKTVAERRENMLWFKVPPKVYFKRGAVDLALRELAGKKKAFIVTDRFLFNSGAVDSITKVLDEIGIDHEVFFDVKPDPTLSTINQAMEIIRPYEPDVFIALGGGSPMDACKIMWLMYEQPDTDFSDISMRFMDIRKRICKIPELGKKASLVAIPTTSGTGSEVTPFAIITDDKTHVKYAITDYALTPSMAIIDPNFVDGMPKGLTASSGFDALVHATEAYVSNMATNFTNSNALEAAKLIFRYLRRAYNEGANDPIAREKMHYAATIAGMAFANSFLGLCHSMAHKLGAMFHVPHGVANALLFRQIIKYNACDYPHKQAIFPQYKYPNAKEKYAQIADELGLGGKTDDEKVELYIQAVDKLLRDINLPLSIKDFGVPEDEFYAKLDEMVELAFDDQCTGANPAYPLMSDIKAIYIDAYNGVVRDYYPAKSAKKSSKK
ncbi:MAG: bifunctional acetaldehyde-CoA/alcohol dehydrogenase [Cyanobacteriota bacterium]|nr:bifunctional acetaldehyde-CoA/alcohol dehydrogenase [Cyanobacteriota bacterium]MDY6383853.1 bifunctional acetaldehyde-CoA/alcohol dehydrogenase [Cyanobacteriota bacterium]